MYVWQVGYGKYDLTPVQVQWLMYQLVCGLHYLHSMGVMHRDLAVSEATYTPPTRHTTLTDGHGLMMTLLPLVCGCCMWLVVCQPTNILVNKNLELKICDLGFARTTAPLGPHDVNLSREAVTQYWRAPEVELSVGGYTQALGTYVWLLHRPGFPRVRWC